LEKQQKKVAQTPKQRKKVSGKRGVPFFFFFDAQA